MLTEQQFIELMTELKEQTRELLLLRERVNEMHIIIARMDFK
jgi:hypothetical protein